MKTLMLAAVVATTVGILGAAPASAAPASGAPLAAAAGEIGGVTTVWYDRWGRWHPNRPVYRGPACRTVRVCGRYRCSWVRRCF